MNALEANTVKEPTAAELAQNQKDMERLQDMRIETRQKLVAARKEVTRLMMKMETIREIEHLWCKDIG